MAAYKEIYYNLPEHEVQDLIKRAQKQDSAAQMELLKVFHNFLTKYVTMLYYGKYNLADYDMRKFAALFVGDKHIRGYLLRNKLNDKGYKHVAECINGIKYMVQRYGGEEDTRQTVNLTFFQCIQRYKPKQSKLKEDEVVPFKGFLYSYFFYLLKRNVDALLIDQLGRKSFPLIADDDFGEEEGGEIVQGFTAPPVPGVEEVIGPDEINEFWVSGDSAMYPFDRLNIQERQLIKWRYVDGFRASEIAKKITEHPNTVREHFNRISNKLNEILEELENN